MSQQPHQQDPSFLGAANFHVAAIDPAVVMRFQIQPKAFIPVGSCEGGLDEPHCVYAEDGATRATRQAYFSNNGEGQENDQC